MRRAAFSLIELMVVVAIIGMLATLVVVNATGRDYDARVAKVGSDFNGLETAIATFRLANGRFPRALEELWQRPGDLPKWGPDPYLHRFPPKDPWGNLYVYEPRGRRYELISYGADGTPGGEAEAADLTATDLLGRSS